MADYSSKYTGNVLNHYQKGDSAQTTFDIPFEQTLGLLSLILSIIFSAACQSQPNQIFIEVDGARQSLTTEAATVREALAEASIELNPLDRVKPDLYVQLEPGLVIVVTRVTEEVAVRREIIPFERQTVVNEALPGGETRLAQLGVNGEDEITVRIVYENGQEVSRTEISQVTIIEPVPEILVVGRQNSSPSSVPIDGTIAYLSNGNAWLMRSNSNSRRALTVEGDLDGQVFSLSPDGRHLLYTTHLTSEADLPLNDMWLASTTIVGEKPITLGIQGILQAEWSPVISQAFVVYTTAERTANPPGWRANNDLWLLDLSALESNTFGLGVSAPKATQLLPANTQGLYPWWGTTFRWSPDGAQLAYARADQIGVIDLDNQPKLNPDNKIRPLLDFAPLQTFSDWVWVPNLSWSPDSRFIAATVHGPPLASEPAEESQVFDLWLFSVDGAISARVAEQVGMWANPAWGAAGIAYGEAINPLQSATSRYNIYLIDRDGSNRRQIFPFSEELGVQLPDITWSPNGQNLLFTYNGNLYLTHQQGGVPKQLTLDGQVSHARWAPDHSLAISGALAITGTQTITGSGVVTTTNINTVTPVASPGQPQTPVATPTPIIRTPTVTATSSPTLTIAPPSPTASAQPSPEASQLAVTPPATPAAP
jgi:hypothetical protein